MFKYFINFVKLIYQKLDKRRVLFPRGIPVVLEIENIKLKSDVLDAGGYDYYKSRKSYEEYASKFYKLVDKAISPSIILDIGANYGFISSISAQRMPNAKVIAIEPSKKMIPYLRENLELNNVQDFEIINSVCGDKDSDTHVFSINPSSSQDNRVLAPKSNWISKQVSMTCIDSVLKDCSPEDSIFIKIDTQGFEEKVFEGGMGFFQTHQNWIVKTEFAPNWLRSQHTDPKKLLDFFVKNFDVAELPATIPFLTESVDDLFRSKIGLESTTEFIAYIEKLSNNKLGWCDLLIRPKTVERKA